MMFARRIAVRARRRKTIVADRELRWRAEVDEEVAVQEPPSGMVERVERILRVFERSRGGLSLGQIALQSGLPRSSVHRIVQQLIEARWLERSEGEYRLGLRMFEIGSSVYQRGSMIEIAQSRLHELCSATGHVVHLAVLDGHDVVYLSKFGSTGAGTLPSRVGGRMPAHCTAVGKAILAFSPSRVVDEYLQTELRSRTSASIAGVGALRDALRAANTFGFATEQDESVPGVACVAAPVLSGGQAVAAISVCGARGSIKIDELRTLVMRAATDISRQLGPGLSTLATA